MAGRKSKAVVTAAFNRGADEAEDGDVHIMQQQARQNKGPDELSSDSAGALTDDMLDGTSRASNGMRIGQSRTKKNWWIVSKNCHKDPTRRGALGALVCALCGLAFGPVAHASDHLFAIDKLPLPGPSAALATEAADGLIDGMAGTNKWDFIEGTIELPSQLSCGVESFEAPAFVGKGVTGAVFGVSASGRPAALKVSWGGAGIIAASVRNEAAILRRLETFGVRGVVRLLAECKYPADAKRVMLLLSPLVVPAETKVQALPTLAARRRAVRQLGDTLVQTLGAAVATPDVQPLFDPSGTLTLIDWTEAVVLSSESPPSSLDVTRADEFARDMVGRVMPVELLSDFREAVDEALQAARPPLAPEIVEVVRRAVNSKVRCAGRLPCV